MFIINRLSILYTVDENHGESNTVTDNHPEVIYAMIAEGDEKEV